MRAAQQIQNNLGGSFQKRKESTVRRWYLTLLSSILYAIPLKLCFQGDATWKSEMRKHICYCWAQYHCIGHYPAVATAGFTLETFGSCNLTVHRSFYAHGSPAGFYFSCSLVERYKCMSVPSCLHTQGVNWGGGVHACVCMYVCHIHFMLQVSVYRTSGVRSVCLEGKYAHKYHMELAGSGRWSRQPHLKHQDHRNLWLEN